MGPLDAIFKPRSIAVVGATVRRGSIGREILGNLFNFEFNGKIFPVNPKYEFIHSTKAYPTVLAIPDPVDLAVIIVPQESVFQAVQDCARKGVKGMVIISAGFREVGGEGIKREEAIMEIARGAGMRVIGPNCMGVIDATPDVRMNATFAPGALNSGTLAFMTQSGALGVAILLAAQKLGLGISYFASVGNKADVSATDLLEYWEKDEHTSVIALYLESFGDPGRFTELSKRISREKPIIVVKSGTSVAGARAATSHTGSLAGLEVAVDALLHQCGVIRVSTIEEMIDVVAGFTRAPLPAGARVCIVTNAGGPAIMATDMIESLGLEVAELQETTKDQIRKFLAPEASVNNPIDMIAGAGHEEYERTMDLVLSDPGVDIAIPIFVPPLMVEPIAVVKRITEVARKHGKPVFLVLMAEEKYYEMIPQKIDDVVPFYRFPEAAVKVASEMKWHASWRDAPAGQVPTFAVDHARAQKVVDRCRDAGGGYLAAADLHEVMDAYGFPICRSATIAPGGDILAAARTVGFPLVLKIDTDEVVHKSDIGGVMVGIKNEKELSKAVTEMRRKVEAAGISMKKVGYLVQEQSAAGKEVILGVLQDSKFGPLLMFGMGGTYVEILRDVSFRVMPVTDVDALDMVQSIKAYPLLEGVRGEEGVDVGFIVECIGRLAQLISEVDGIYEMDINPIIVTSDRSTCRAVDARIHVAAPPR